MSEELQEALARVHGLREQVEQRRHDRSGPSLPVAACERGCMPCYRPCAISRIKLGWWESELDRLGGDPVAPALAYRGMRYASVAGRC